MPRMTQEAARAALLDALPASGVALYPEMYASVQAAGQGAALNEYRRMVADGVIFERVVVVNGEPRHEVSRQPFGEGA